MTAVVLAITGIVAAVLAGLAGYRRGWAAADDVARIRLALAADRARQRYLGEIRGLRAAAAASQAAAERARRDARHADSLAFTYRNALRRLAQNTTAVPDEIVELVDIEARGAAGGR